MKRSEIILGLLRIPLDYAMTVAGLIAGYYLRLQSDFIPGLQFYWSRAGLLPLEEYLKVSLLFGGLLILVFFYFGLYQFKNTQGPLREARSVLKHSAVWILVVMSYFFLTRKVFFSRLVLVYGFAFSVIFILVERLLLRAFEKILLKHGIGRRNLLFVGSSDITSHLAKALCKDPHYAVQGYISEKPSELPALKRLGTLKALEALIESHKIESILVTDQNLSEIQDERILELCRERHLEYRFVPEILELERSNIEIDPLAGFPVINLKPTPLDGWGRIWKRSLDLFGSSLGLALLSPVFLLIALGIRLDSKGPIFFSKLEDGSPATRVGQNGKPFTFYKFRTMQANTHHLRSELATLSHRKGPLLKIKNDPRITRFGRFLRRSSLDELPNLWNVLRGEMSLVGPRPHLPEEVSRYEKHHHFLLTIKPGITGLSQVSGRSDLDFDEESRLDSFYIKHWSLAMDLKILLKTILVVFGGKAAD